MRHYFRRIKAIAAARTKKSIKRLYNLIDQSKGNGIDQPLMKNARECKICHSSAHRWEHMFQCSKNPGHIADLNTGIFNDHSRDEYDTYN